jgi:hypothetical protein
MWGMQYIDSTDRHTKVQYEYIDSTVPKMLHAVRTQYRSTRGTCVTTDQHIGYAEQKSAQIHTRIIEYTNSKDTHVGYTGHRE